MGNHLSHFKTLSCSTTSSVLLPCDGLISAQSDASYVRPLLGWESTALEVDDSQTKCPSSQTSRAYSLMSAVIAVDFLGLMPLNVGIPSLDAGSFFFFFSVALLYKACEKSFSGMSDQKRWFTIWDFRKYQLPALLKELGIWSVWILIIYVLSFKSIPRLFKFHSANNKCYFILLQICVGRNGQP